MVASTGTRSLSPTMIVFTDHYISVAKYVITLLIIYGTAAGMQGRIEATFGGGALAL